MLRDNLDKIGQVRLQPYKCSNTCNSISMSNSAKSAGFVKLWAIAGHEGEAAAAHDNIADVANEDASCICNPVSSGS